MTDTPIDVDALEALEALEKAATLMPWSQSGKWKSEINSEFGSVGELYYGENNAAFIVAIRNAAPTLIAANRRLLDVTAAVEVMIESKWRAAEIATKDGDAMGAFGFTSQAATLREILLLLQPDKQRPHSTRSHLRRTRHE